MARIKARLIAAATIRKWRPTVGLGMNNAMTASVSVIMPAHNSERFIGAAIDSVLAQKKVNLEIIVIDDGSSDETANVAKAALAQTDNAQCLLISQPNRGAAAARNAG